MGDGESFTFTMNNPLLNYTGAYAELTNPFVKTAGVGTDWEVDAVNYRLKYVNPSQKIYQLSLRQQQVSSTTNFRNNIQVDRIVGIGNSDITFIGGTSSNGVKDNYPHGFFYQVQENTILGFQVRDANGAAGTSTDFTFTVFLNELR